MVKAGPPPYGRRQGFIPRVPEDFGDGGAFPEIHVAQYPLDMGRKNKASTAIVSVQVDQQGKVRYDSLLAAQGQTKQVKSTYKDLVPVAYTEEDLVRPGPEEEKETTERTRAALEKLVNIKISATQPAKTIETDSKTTYVRYTPANSNPAHNAGSSTRVIRMVEIASDPLEPPKFKRTKMPRGPPSPPVPVMRSPPRKVTMKDQQDWKIPPCISNWKNAKGYTIPLDKRLAADGRGLQEVTINDNFSKLSEALYIAERNAREEVEKRNQIQVKLALKEQQKKEEMLRRLAEDARKQRQDIADMEVTAAEEAAPEDLEERQKRDEIREERRRDRERERRLEELGKKTAKYKRDADRDVSERIALGMKAPPQSQETQYDQRLFNQSAGMDSGFGQEDSYTVYDKPLFAGSSASQIYRPRFDQSGDMYGNEDAGAAAGGPAPEGRERKDDGKSLDTSKFKPDRDFTGVDRSQKAAPRSRPVEFEKSDDPFGLDEFLQDAKSGRRGAPSERDRESSKRRDADHERSGRDEKRRK
jgi:SNW domain-containing protein 1